MSIKAVFFDIGETLWHSKNRPSEEGLLEMSVGRVAEVMGAHGLTGTDPALVAKCSLRAVDSAVEHARGGSLEEPNYAAVAADALRAAGLSVSVEQAGALIDAAYISGPEGGKVASEDARSTLDALRARGFRLATVTNRAFGGERFREDLRSAGLDVGWDTQAISVEVGYMKPHPAIFEHALNALQIEPAQAFMVGNSLREDVAGAQEVGILAAWVESPPDARGVIPDYTVKCVSELLAVPALETT